MVERLKFHLITCIALLYLTTGNMCMPVQAAELEPRESTGEEEICTESIRCLTEYSESGWWYLGICQYM